MELQELIPIISTAGGALSLAIGILWKTVMDLSKKQVDMSQELGNLKGKQDGIRNLSYQVLDTVRESVNKNQKNNNE